MAYKNRDEQRSKQAAYHQRMKSNPEYRARRKVNSDNTRARKQDVILDYLKENPCLDCGEADPIVLEFDHLRDKLNAVGHLLAGNYSLETLLTEIEKCEIVCCNCHQRRTAKRGNYWKTSRD